MVALAMIMDDELGDRAAKMSLAQRDHAIKTLILDRANEPLRVRVAVWCPERRPDDPDTLLFEELQHGTTPLAVPIANQHAPVCQDAVNRIRQAADGLQYEGFIRLSR